MCSYCGCENIAVVGRFMTEHAAIVNASGNLRRACERGEPTGVVAAADALDRLLHPHTRAEEVGLFTVLAEDDEFTDHVRQLCSEHVELDGALDFE